jgi:hypothetical protein
MKSGGWNWIGAVFSAGLVCPLSDLLSGEWTWGDASDGEPERDLGDRHSAVGVFIGVAGTRGEAVSGVSVGEPG